MTDDTKRELEQFLLTKQDEFHSKTPSRILVDFIATCLAAYESQLVKEDAIDTTEYLAQCLAAYQAAARAKWRYEHVAVSFGFPKKTTLPGAHDETKI